MKKNIFRRALSALLAVLILISVTACSKSAPTEESASEKKNASVENGIKDDLTIGLSAMWTTLSPFQGSNMQYANFLRLLYDRLGVFKDGECIKQAADSWEVAEDGVTWTVKIRDGITDSAGTRITADDVVWFINQSIERAMKPQFNNIASVETVDDLTFQLVMKSNVVGTFELVMAQVYMVSQSAFEASADEFANTVVSSGPYEVVEFVASSHLTLHKRADYWDAGNQEPLFQNNAENVTYKVIAEPSQQQVAVETGTVDAFETITASLVSGFERSNDAYQISSNWANNGVQMYFSGDENSPVNEDVNLRKAIAYAIDVPGLISSVFEGRADMLYDPASPTLMGYQKDWENEEYFPYSLEKAKEYLAQSDYNGEPLRLMGVSQGDFPKVLQTIQAYLMAAGIECELNLVDNALFAASLYDGSQYDMILVSAGGMIITNLWSIRFDMNARESGDGTGRHDEVLTEMIYKTWVQDGFTPENINAIHEYIKENCICYGLYIPYYNSISTKASGIVSAPVGASGNPDYVAAIFQ